MNEERVTMRVSRFWQGVRRNHVGAQSEIHVMGFDTETKDGVVYYTGVYDGESYQDHYGVDDHADWLIGRLLEKMQTRKDKTLVLFAHYLTFDLGVLFYEYLKGMQAGPIYPTAKFSIVKWKVTVELFMGKPCFARLRRGKQTLLMVDTWAFLKCSLKEALKMVKAPIQKRTPPRGLGSRIIPESRLRAYAEADVMGVYYLGEKIVEWHRRYDVRLTVSGPMMAGRIFRHQFVKHDFKWCDGLTRMVSMLSYHGGKNSFQVKPGWVKRCYELDIRSAYPEAMADLPDFHYGRFETVQRYAGRWGVYRISGIVKSCRWGCVFSHDYQKLEGEVNDVWITGYEIEEALRAQEISITHLVGIVWVPSSKESERVASPFKAYVEHFYRLKEAATNEEERAFYKLCLNALYGKFVNRNLNDQGELIGGAMFYPFVGSLITGFVNAKMHRLEHQYQAIHTATDSIKTVQAPAIRDLGPEMGKLKIELYGDCLILRNKLYVHYDQMKHKRKVGLHGFHGTADELLDIYRRGELYYSVKRLVHWKEAFRRGLRPGSEVTVPLELKLSSGT